MSTLEHSFDGFGPFADSLDQGERNARLDRLAAAAGTVCLAAYIEMINLTKVHAARNLGPVCDTLNRMKPEERRALREAYAASA